MFVDEDGEHLLEPGQFCLTGGSCSPGIRRETLETTVPADFDLISPKIRMICHDFLHSPKPNNNLTLGLWTIGNIGGKSGWNFQ